MNLRHVNHFSCYGEIYKPWKIPLSLRDLREMMVVLVMEAKEKPSLLHHKHRIVRAAARREVLRA